MVFVDETSRPATRAPRPWWRRRSSLAAAFVLAAILSGLVFARWNSANSASKGQVAVAVAETDRLDPGWRWDDLQGRRTPIPDGENSAPRVLAAAALISDEAVAWMPREYELYRPISRFGGRPDRDIIAELQWRLEPLRPALARARDLAHWPRGRYRPVALDDLLRPRPGSRLRDEFREPGESIRKVTRLLYFDAIARAAGGDVDGGLESCLALLNAARSIGDDPSQRLLGLRPIGDHLAAAAVEQVLAFGTPSEPALRALQAALEDELAVPLSLNRLRSDRAVFDRLCELIIAGKAGWMGEDYQPGWPRHLLEQPRLNANRARLLAWSTRAVEEGKRPRAGLFLRMETLRKECQAWALAHSQGWPKVRLPGRGVRVPFVDTYPGPGEGFMLADSFFSGLAQGPNNDYDAQAVMGAAVVALAAERFRLAHGRLPEGAADLVPSYLARIPDDPFQDGRLILRRVADGLDVYSPGFDHKDNGNARATTNSFDGSDEGVRLWEPARRGLRDER